MRPYERLLLDAAGGKSEFFAREDQVEETWRIVDPVLDDKTPVHPYAPGTWGPREAGALQTRDEEWPDPCGELSAPDA